MVPYASVVFCEICLRWRKYGNSITKYKKHVALHSDNALPPLIVEPELVRLELIGNHLQRGDPFRAIDSLRRLSVGRDLPNRRQLVSIIHLLHMRIIPELIEEVQKAKFVNLAIDGWTDPCNRRYQGVTARFVSETNKVKSAVLVLKEVMEVHETGVMVRAVVDNVVEKFGLQEKIVNICTDRDSKNTCAFRTHPLPPGCHWIPCAAHFLNLILQHFYENAAEIVDQIFHMAATLRKRPAFTAFLQAHGSTHLRLPAFSRIRWYSSTVLFTRLQQEWHLITEYCNSEDLQFPALQALKHITVLSQLASSFQQTELALEGDHFASGAHFMPKLLRILYNINKFATDYPKAVQAVNAYVDEFKAKFGREYLMFLLATFFYGGRLHFQFGDGAHCTCTPTEYEAMRDLALELIEQEMERHSGEAEQFNQFEDPPSDDFSTPRRHPVTALAIDQFIAFETARREFPPEWWQKPPRSMLQVAAVAERVASWMITSSSVERAFSVAGSIASKRRMRISSRNLHAQLMVQANWSIAKKFLAEVLALGPDEWSAEEDRRGDRTGIDPFSEDLMIDEAEEEEEEEMNE
jgi:hypothetical protein